ncbi:MAG: DUF1574 domain-containing protein [candidate division Zixibacteria bacterium]|nr:DUF1574 domain-containing protein [candidate division Zixibacteria bacterium]
MKRFLKRLTLFASIFIILQIPLLLISWHLDKNQLSMHIELDKLERIKQAGDHDILIMGDSRAFAMNRDAEFASANSIYNLSLANPGGLYPYPYLLKRYLKYHKPPSAIILSFIPLMLTDEWDIFAEDVDLTAATFYRSARLYSISDMLTEPVFREHPMTVARMLLRYLSPNKIYEKLKFNSDINGYKPETGYFTVRETKEWNFDPDVYLLNTPLEISDKAVLFMDYFLSIARDNDIPVVLYNMPIPESVYRIRSEDGFYSKYFQVIDEMAAKYPNTLTVYREIEYYPDNYFIDGSHLNEKGAVKFNHSDFVDIVQMTKQCYNEPALAEGGSKKSPLK